MLFRHFLDHFSHGTKLYHSQLDCTYYYYSKPQHLYTRLCYWKLERRDLYCLKVNVIIKLQPFLYYNSQLRSTIIVRNLNISIQHQTVTEKKNLISLYCLKLDRKESTPTIFVRERELNRVNGVVCRVSLETIQAPSLAKQERAVRDGKGGAR